MIYVRELSEQYFYFIASHIVHMRLFLFIYIILLAI